MKVLSDSSFESLDDVDVGEWFISTLNRLGILGNSNLS